jgi:hypothetical protein
MIVIKVYPCETKIEACMEEDKLMREMKVTMNVRWAYTSPDEKSELRKDYRENNRDKRKEYCEANRESLIDYIKDYRQANQELIREQTKGYYQENKEQICEYQKKYRQANQELIRERNTEYRIKFKQQIECECGYIVRRDSLYRHIHSKKHLKVSNNY